MKKINLSLLMKIVSLGICPALLIVACYLGVFFGVDLSDVTYSVTNYMFLGEIEGSWIYATFLANLVGSGLVHLSGGSLLVMNILTRLILVALVLLPYYQLRKYVPWPLLFSGELVAIGLSWCPSVILYNYLTYLMMTGALLFLFFGLVKDKNYHFICAGLLFGINILTRFSNLTECVFILVVWYASILDHDKKWIKRTLLSLGGYLAGCLIAVGILYLAGGPEAIPQMADWLIGLLTGNNKDANDYSMKGMLLGVFRYYMENIRWFAGLIVLFGFGNVLYLLLREKYTWLKRILFIGSLGLLLVWYYRNGVITTIYRNTGAFFHLAVVMIMLSLLVYILMLVMPGMKREERILGFMAFIILIIAPLGSNNHLFTCMNQLYLVAPITIMGICRLIGLAAKQKIEEPIMIAGVVLLVILTIQGILFRANYVFGDEEPGAHETMITNIDSLDGMLAREEDVLALEGLVEASTSLRKENASLITFGNIPGIHYVLSMKPALSNAWPDLDSYSVSDFKMDLYTINDKQNTYVIITRDVVNGFVQNMMNPSTKEYALAEFLYGNRYQALYTNDQFILYGCQ